MWSHLEQCEPSVRPVFKQSGATALSVTISCPSASTTVCATLWSHLEQCEPSVRPVAVQVGATASSITSVWPRASTVMVSRLSSSPQTVQ